MAANTTLEMRRVAHPDTTAAATADYLEALAGALRSGKAEVEHQVRSSEYDVTDQGRHLPTGRVELNIGVVLRDAYSEWAAVQAAREG